MGEKKKKTQDTTVADRFARLTRATKLLNKYPEHTMSFVTFSDEKCFTLVPPMTELPKRPRSFEIRNAQEVSARRTDDS